MCNDHMTLCNNHMISLIDPVYNTCLISFITGSSGASDDNVACVKITVFEK